MWNKSSRFTEIPILLWSMDDFNERAGGNVPCSMVIILFQHRLTTVYQVLWELRDTNLSSVKVRRVSLRKQSDPSHNFNQCLLVQKVAVIMQSVSSIAVQRDRWQKKEKGGQSM